MENWTLDSKDMDALIDMIDVYGDNARESINEVLHGSGAMEIRRNIAQLIPVSGRTFKGHLQSAKSVMPFGFSQDNENLAVTIAARGKYHYLYFPDDGSDTIKHAGGQDFFGRGADASTDYIIEEVGNKLIEKFEVK